MMTQITNTAEAQKTFEALMSEAIRTARFLSSKGDCRTIYMPISIRAKYRKPEARVECTHQDDESICHLITISVDIMSNWEWFEYLGITCISIYMVDAFDGKYTEVSVSYMIPEERAPQKALCNSKATHTYVFENAEDACIPWDDIAALCVRPRNTVVPVE